jgi:hypothetical protein
MENGRSRKYIKLGRTQFLRGENIDDWTPDLIREQMKEFYKLYQPFTVKLFGLYRKPVADQRLSKVIGKHSSRKFFHYVACHYFGSWDEAMRSAGLVPTKTSHNKFWNQELLISSIIALHRAGHPLTVKSIWKDRRSLTTKTIHTAIGKKTTGSGLHDAARRYFGSWDLALQASGIESSYVKEKPFWTKDKIIKAIQAVHEREIALNTDKIGRDCRPLTSKIIKLALGKTRSGRSLHGGAYRIFGSWDRALIAANINPNDVRKVPFSWNRRSISRLLNVLYECDIPINSSSLLKDRSEQTSSILFDYTGQKISAPKIYKIAKDDFGNWDSVLKFSGFKLSEVRKSGSPCFKEIEKIVEIVRALNKNEFALNRSSLNKQSYLIKFFLEDHFGSAISGLSVLNAALLFFENWDDVLWEAGLDPSSIRLRSRPHLSNISITPHQKEDTKVDGERRLSNFAGWAPKNPEELMNERETSTCFWSTMNQINDADQDVTQKIFDAILNLHHYKNSIQMVKFISQDTGIEEERIQSIINQFKNKYAGNKNASLFI